MPDTQLKRPGLVSIFIRVVCGQLEAWSIELSAGPGDGVLFVERAGEL